ncbi:MAG: VOC family protein [Candidatus Hodarchaeota archaeon]
MPKVVHFELGAEDPERAVKFYKEVFGWKIEKWEGPMDYWLITASEECEEGINGAIMHREYPQKTINTIDVPSVDEFVEKIVEAGGKVVQPKTTIPSIGYFAYCEDTEGIMFGILEADPSAK